MTNSPQSQAEAMAVEVIKEWRLTGNALVSCISTALSKLIAENERLMDDARQLQISRLESAEINISLRAELNSLQSQLTAKEKKICGWCGSEYNENIQLFECGSWHFAHSGSQTNTCAIRAVAKTIVEKYEGRLPADSSDSISIEAIHIRRMAYHLSRSTPA